MIKAEAAKVVIADDEDDTRQFLVEFLTELGHSVVAVATGRAAVAAAKQELPDVILLDVMMPEMSGLEACQIIKEDPTTADIPIIFVTAKATVNDQLKGLHMGAHDYINKPYRITELASRLNSAVRVKRLNDLLKKYRQEKLEYQELLHKQVREPLEKSKELMEELLKKRVASSTRDSLIKIQSHILESLSHFDAAPEKS